MSTAPLCDFFIIGAAKAGTTSLHARLQAHPDLFLTEPKEPEFFARDDRYDAGIDSYAALFDDAKPDQLRGDASTLYSLAPLFPKTAERIKTHCPEAKFIYMLREPVKRSYSYYGQLVKNRQNATQDFEVRRSFEDFLYGDRAALCPRDDFFAPFDTHFPDVPEVLTAGSHYCRQIDAYFAHFAPEKFLFLAFEDFIKDQDAATAKVLEFLGVDPAKMPRQEATSVNRAVDHNRTVAQSRQVRGLMRRLGPVAALRHLLPDGLRQKLRRRALARMPQDTANTHVPPPMHPQTAAKLAAEFYADFDRLETLTGLDLKTAWGRGANG
ncbi:sulfotransferase [Litorivita sp. NS0012-18]|uniref:sulfotransferase family protein n=1 Tax=Litorivita sp. NS0012-18 TaxID=3127655 RepID=UPI0031021505